MIKNFTVFLSLAVFFFCVSTACAEELREIKVGIFPMKPLNFIDDDGNAKGLFPDLLREVVRSEGWHLTFYPGSWRECYERVQNGEIDLFTTVMYSPERAQIFDFNKVPVADIWGRIYSKPEAKITEIKDLTGMPVAIAKRDMNGQNFIKTAKKFDVHPVIVEVETHYDIFQSVQNGEAVAGVVPQHFGFREAKNYGLVPTTIEFEPVPVFFAVAKGKNGDLLTHIDKHLTSWKQKQGSVYYKQVAYWMGGHSDSSWVIPRWLIISMAISAGTVLLLIAMTVSLKYQVRNRTRELASREARFRRLTESTMAIPWELDLDTLKFTYVGPQIVGMFGYPLSFWTDFAAWESVIHSDDREKSVVYCQQMTGAGKDHDFVYRLMRKDGTICWIKDIVSIEKGSDGRPKKLCGYLIDITERKQAEENLLRNKYVLEKAQEIGVIGTWELDIVNDKLFWTDEACRIFGVPEGSVINFDVFINKVHPADHEYVIYEWQAAMKGKPYDIEHRLLSDGRVRWVREKARINFDDNGNAISAIGVVQDITDRKQLMDEYRRSTQLAALGTVAAGVAHEINNPIQGIINYATLIVNAPDKTDRVADMSARIVKEGNRIANITHDMLHYAKDNRGEHGEVDILNPITAAVSLVKLNYKHSDVDIDLELPTAPVVVIANPQWVQQVVVNLIENAIDAVLEKGEDLIRGTIKVMGKVVEEGESSLFMLEILDNGIGIPEENLVKVRDAFFTTKQKSNGTGLGLSIVGDIVAKHHGSLKIESEEGRYTKVTVFLPVAKESL